MSASTRSPAARASGKWAAATRRQRQGPAPIRAISTTGRAVSPEEPAEEVGACQKSPPSMMGQSGAPPAAPGGAPPGSPSPAPAAAPMSAPAPSAGQHAKGRLRLQIIAKLLNETIGMLAMGSDEWKDAIAMLKLAGPYGGGVADSPLGQTELKSMGQNAPSFPQSPGPAPGLCQSDPAKDRAAPRRQPRPPRR